MYNIEMVKFNVGSFLDILVDFWVIKNLDEISFLKVKLWANGDESEVEI